MTSSQLSTQERRRAWRIYHATKWLTWLALGSLCFAINVEGMISLKSEPELIKNLSSSIWIVFTLVVGEKLAIHRIQQVGLANARQESRIIVKTTPIEEPFTKTDPENKRSVRRILYQGQLLVFAPCWAFFFGLFWLLHGGTGFERRDDAESTAFLALWPATVLFLVFLFVAQDPRAKWEASVSYEEIFQKAVPWSAVAQAEEVCVWNFKNNVSECYFLFRSQGGKVLKRVKVPPAKAEVAFAEVEARLRGESKISPA